MKSTRHFEMWAEDKHPFVAVFAHGLVSQAKIAYGITKAIHEEDMFFGELPAPNLDTWLKLFRSHRNGISYFSQFIGDPGGFMESAGDLAGQFDKDALITATDISMNDAENLFDQYIKMLNTSEEEIAQNLQIEKVEQFILAPEFYFFFRVYIP